MPLGLAQAPFQCILDGSGNGTVRIQNENPLVVWIVRQIYVVCNPQKPGASAVISQAAFGSTRSYYAGTGDTAAGDPPVYLYRGYWLDVAFSGGPSGGQGLAVAYYQEEWLDWGGYY